jgi:hypothetical protein
LGGEILLIWLQSIVQVKMSAKIRIQICGEFDAIPIGLSTGHFTRSQNREQCNCQQNSDLQFRNIYIVACLDDGGPPPGLNRSNPFAAWDP